MNLHEKNLSGSTKPVEHASVVSTLSLKPARAHVTFLAAHRHLSLGLRTQPSGKQSYVVIRRPKGSDKVATITLCPAERGEAAAVRLAIKAVAELDAGRNPNEAAREKREAERAVRAAKANTFATLANSYITSRVRLGRRASSLLEYRRILASADLKPWHDRPIGNITKAQLQELIERVRERAPTMANRVLEFLTAVFKHAELRDAIAVNPTTRLDRGEVRHKEKPRKRTLVHPITGDRAELTAVWRAAESYEPEHHPVRALIKLLILTGARVGTFARAHPGQTEALNWRMVKDLDKPEHARIEVPPALRKTGDDGDADYIIALSPAAVAVLNGMAKVSDDAPVFTIDGKQPLKITAELRDALRKRADVEAGQALERWTLHDLRRSVATGLRRLGAPAGVVDEILDHAGAEKAGIRATYDLSKRVDLCREWLARWAAEIEKE